MTKWQNDKMTKKWQNDKKMTKSIIQYFTYPRSTQLAKLFYHIDFHFYNAKNTLGMASPVFFSDLNETYCTLLQKVVTIRSFLDASAYLYKVVCTSDHRLVHLSPVFFKHR